MNKSPDAFRTISEVAEKLDVPAHVLRFWETRFSQVKPVKRGGGRRYYRPDDVRLLRGIRGLLYDDGMTIKGVQKILREQGVRHVIGLGTVDGAEAPAPMPPARMAAKPAAAVAPVPVMAEAGAAPERLDAPAPEDDAAENPDWPRAESIEETPVAIDEAGPEDEREREPEATAEGTAAEDEDADEDADLVPVPPGDRAALSRLVAELEALRRVMTEKPRP